MSIMYYKNALTQNGVSEKWVCFVALLLSEVVVKKKEYSNVERERIERDQVVFS